MSLPDVTLTIKDGSLGVLPESVDGLSVKVGVSSLGVANTLYAFTRKEDVVATLGTGPLVEAAAYHLDASGQPVICVPVNASVAGVAGAITKGNPSSPTVTVAGTPLDAYEVILQVTRTGILGAGAFQYSLDGGDTFSPEIAIPGSGTYALTGTGLTLTFPAGTYTAGDTYTFSCTAPGYNLADLNAALTALLADPREWGFVHVVGAGTASIAAGVDSQMTAAANAYRFAFAIMEAALQGATEDATWQAALVTEYASFASTRVMVCAGEEELVSPISGRIYRRSAAWVAAARCAKAPISEDLGRVASGAVSGVSKLYHDEQVNPGLDAKQFTTLRTIIGLAGFWITAGRLMAPAGSDFALVQRRRVMDRACKVARTALLTFLNDKVLVNDDGTIDEVSARAIERFVQGQVDADLRGAGHISSVSVSVDRAGNILSTQTLTATVSIVPVGYARAISATIGFINPALELKAA